MPSTSLAVPLSIALFLWGEADNEPKCMRFFCCATFSFSSSLRFLVGRCPSPPACYCKGLEPEDPIANVHAAGELAYWLALGRGRMKYIDYLELPRVSHLYPSSKNLHLTGL
jgi:hypothetical protein